MNNILHVLVVVLLAFAIGGIAGYSTGASHQKQSDDSYYTDQLSAQNLKNDQECLDQVNYIYNLCLGLIEDNCKPDVKVNPKTLPPILPTPDPNDQGL